MADALTKEGGKSKVNKEVCWGHLGRREKRVRLIKDSVSYRKKGGGGKLSKLISLNIQEI